MSFLILLLKSDGLKSIEIKIGAKINFNCISFCPFILRRYFSINGCLRKPVITQLQRNIDIPILNREWSHGILTEGEGTVQLTSSSR